MFVRKAKFEDAVTANRILMNTNEDLRRGLVRVREEYEKLIAQWNVLVKQINKKGGTTFLDEGRIIDPNSEIGLADIDRLLMLCHPDKHDGKQSATEMTAKLLKLKERLEQK